MWDSLQTILNTDGQVEVLRRRACSYFPSPLLRLLLCKGFCGHAQQGEYIRVSGEFFEI